MNITADTNVLLRAVLEDDRTQSAAAQALLRAGGDFADGVIAAQGMSLGGTTFASFDRDAVAALQSGGMAAADPSVLVADAAAPGFPPPDRP